MKKRMLFVTFLFFLNSIFADAIYRIDFFGVSSTDLDKNMADMTSDLYFTQLCEIKNFEVSDKRDTSILIPDSENFTSGRLAFYSVISKKENSSKWVSTLHIFNPDENSEMTAAKEYDSYYKILMESKIELQNSFISLIQNNSSSQGPISEPKTPTVTAKASTENLAGTWSGEQNIEKILIMRGGRGFVIFKNGASMNIDVRVEGSTVIISQTGKANASFFPDLPRQQALEAALTADPITWKLNLTSENKLNGTKSTLIAEGDSFTTGNIPVEWNRKQ